MKQRYDIYAFIHKGLRAWTSEVLSAAGRVDVSDADDCAQLSTALRELIAAHRGHLEHEERFIHPALEAARPGASGQTEAEHAEHLAGLDAIEKTLRAWESSQGAERSVAARSLYRELACWTAQALQHMEMEERDNNAVLWSHYTDEQIAALEARLVGAVAPAAMLAYLHHMVPAMAPFERAQLLGGMQQALPASVFSDILGQIKQRLSSRDWFKLLLALGPMPLGV